MKIMSFHNKHPVQKFSVSMGNKYIYIYLELSFDKTYWISSKLSWIHTFAATLISRVLVRKNKGYNRDKGLSLKYNTKN